MKKRNIATIISAALFALVLAGVIIGVRAGFIYSFVGLAVLVIAYWLGLFGVMKTAGRAWAAWCGGVGGAALMAVLIELIRNPRLPKGSAVISVVIPIVSLLLIGAVIGGIVALFSHAAREHYRGAAIITALFFLMLAICLFTGYITIYLGSADYTAKYFAVTAGVLLTSAFLRLRAK